MCTPTPKIEPWRLGEYERSIREKYGIAKAFASEDEPPKEAHKQAVSWEARKTASSHIAPGRRDDSGPDMVSTVVTAALVYNSIAPSPVVDSTPSFSCDTSSSFSSGGFDGGGCGGE